MSVIKKIYRLYSMRSAKSYEMYLRRKGVRIGHNLKLFNHRSIRIDTSSPCLLEIGDNVSITADVSILTHDYVSSVFVHKFNDYVPSRSKVTIGNNVYIGQKVIILRGVTIGDNCIIGAGAIVSKDIPANSVAVGVPAKVVCSIEDYYQRCKKKSVEEAQDYLRNLSESLNRKPKVEDFRDEFGLFWNEEINCSDDFRTFVKDVQLDGQYDEFLRRNEPLYASFEDFLNNKRIVDNEK